MHSTENSQGPQAASLPAAKVSRRWSVRQKIHSPAYVSVNPCEDGTIFGLNQVFDIGTDGLSFQNSEQLEPGSRVRMNLELSGVEGPLRAAGRVVWSEPSGRTGVQFRKSSLSAPRRLEEYLFLNAVTACAHYGALQSGAAGSESSDLVEGAIPQTSSAPLADSLCPDYAAVLECLTQLKSGLEGVEVNDEHLQLLAEQVGPFLNAAGVAIAIVRAGRMVCRASFGEAPPKGTQIQIGVGFTGECVRKGILMCCEDAENDPRADREICRVLNIRSIMAAPIRYGTEVAGLIEVFSPRAQAFDRNGRLFLQRLSEILASVSRRPSRDEEFRKDEIEPAPNVPELATSTGRGQLELPEPADSAFAFGGMHRILVLGAVAALLLGVALFVPLMRTRAGNSRTDGIVPQTFRPTQPKVSSDSEQSEFDQLRDLASAGDPDAEFALGVRYATGDEVRQDYATAVRWFSRSAEQGQVVAQATLGAYYWAGRGVPEDLHKAYFWSVLAQANGDESSKYRLISLASRMNHEEIVQIQQDANEWLKHHQTAAPTDTRR
jgi:uncharacterized protein